MSDGAKARALLGKLAADGEREALATVARAREEAERIARESAARCVAALERAKGARLAELAERESVARMHAMWAARRDVLDAKRALVERVLSAAIALLASGATDAWLAAEVERTLAYLPDGAARIRCAKGSVAAVRKMVASRASTDVVADDTVGAGMLAEMLDGTLMVDATAGSRLERLRGALAIEIVAAVSGGA